MTEFDGDVVSDVDPNPADGRSRSPDGGQVSLERLTGVRSSKHTFYPEFRRKAEGLNRAIAALEQVSATLAMTTAGPEALARSVVDVAATHFGGRWAAMALSKEAFGAQPPCLVARFADGSIVSDWDSLEPVVAAALTRVLEKARSAHATDGHVPRGEPLLGPESLGTPMYLASRAVGALAVETSGLPRIAEEDLAVLHTLGNQAAVALRSACLYEDSEHLRMKAAAALEMSEHHATELELRNRQLQRAQDRLLQARQRQILDQERHRIGRDLHDSVAQHLVSIGMNLEWCLQQGGAPPDIRSRLVVGKKMARQTVSQIRRTIYDLSLPDEDRLGLRVALQDLAGDFLKTSEVDVSVRFVGRAVLLPAATEHALFQVAQEAMFNVVKHSLATRATIELRYDAKSVGLVVADNGFGDPRALRKYLDKGANGRSGHNRGLCNIAERVREFGGEVTIRKRRGGGISLAVHAPLKPPPPQHGSHA